MLLNCLKEANIDPVIGQVVYSDTIAMDALGNVTSQKLGNRTIDRTYEQSSGRLTYVESYLAGNTATKDKLTLTYDVLGNLKSRKRESDISHLTQESFCYDALNRLTKSHTGTFREGLNDKVLQAAIAEIERGLVDADLGGHVMKKRVAIGGRGKSGGVCTLLVYQFGHKAFFVYDFAKSARANISADELRALKRLAKELLGCSDKVLKQAIEYGELIEVESDG